MSKKEGDFQGITPEMYLEEARRLGSKNAYWGMAKELQRWYDWIKEHDLQPLSFADAVKVYREAEAQARKEKEADSPPAEVYKAYLQGSADTPENLKAQEEAGRIFWEYQYAVKKRIGEVLERWDYFMWPHTWMMNLDPETLEPLDLGSTVIDKRRFIDAPVDVWAICRLKEGKPRPPPYPRLSKPQLIELEANFVDFHRAFSMKPAQAVDRAARGPRGWSYPLDEPPRYADPRNSHIIEYYIENMSLQALRESVEKLNPRTADVWRLVTAACLEAWQDGQIEPSAVWIDVRQLCDAMGYKKHHKGGYKREHVLEAVRALKDLQSLKITIPLGAETYPIDARTGKRKAAKIEARRTYEVIMVAATDEVREMFTGERYPLRWLIRPGEWIKNYPKQFAPLYRTLVELPAQKTAHVWAKAIGTELTWQYRENGDKPKTLKVRTLLEQTDLLNDLLKEPRNRGRARTNLEGALDVLEDEGICKGWEYNSRDVDAVEAAGTQGWFEPWLEARIIVTPPSQIAGAIGKVKARASAHKGRTLKRKGQAKRTK